MQQKYVGSNNCFIAQYHEEDDMLLFYDVEFRRLPFLTCIGNNVTFREGLVLPENLLSAYFYYGICIANCEIDASSITIAPLY